MTITSEWQVAFLCEDCHPDDCGDTYCHSAKKDGFSATCDKCFTHGPIFVCGGTPTYHTEATPTTPGTPRLRTRMNVNND